MEPTRLRVRDAVQEASAAMFARPGRAVLTTLGTLLGVAAFVAVLGLTATAGGQISSRFTALAATEVTVQDAPENHDLTDVGFPPDAERRLTALNGVEAAGVFWQPSITGGESAALVGTRPPSLAGGEGEPLTTIAASPGFLRAVRAQVASGRLYGEFHERTRQRVALLGRAAAARLGIDRVDAQPAIFIGESAFTVIGIVDDVERRPETLLSVIVPDTTAVELWGNPGSGNGATVQALIETRLGAAQLVARQAPPALRPDQPERFKVIAPPDPKQLKRQVDTDLDSLFLALALICLVIGAVGIANTTLIAVLERTAEIGLRRSLGARRIHIAVQFLCESATLGLLGGLVGTSVGIVTVVGVAIARDWTAVLEPLAVLPAPLIGAVTGLVAGFYPAWRASRIEPVEALRR